MFGFSKTTPNTDDAKAAAMAAARKTVRDTIHELAMAPPEQAERLTGRLKSYLEADKTLPFDYKQKARQKARELECNSNMRVADKLMHLAVQLAADEHLSERTKKLGDARRYFSKACLLGADQEWRKAFDRLNETAMMTGGVHRAGPSRAKPLDTAPSNPNRAKG